MPYEHLTYRGCKICILKINKHATFERDHLKKKNTRKKNHVCRQT